MEIKIGDTATLKKPHPCGSLKWTVTRTGADIKLKCLTCGREVMMTRGDAEKRIKSLQHPEANE